MSDVTNLGFGSLFFQLYQGTGHTIWQNQTTWYINPTTGNDQNDGLTSITAIQTVAELRFRLNGMITATSLVTINILGSLPTNDPLHLVLESRRPTTSSTATALSIKGIRTTLATGTITTTSSAVPATNTSALFQDTGVTSWTPYIGNHIRVTSGAALGNVAVICKDVGSNTTRISSWYNPTTFAAGTLPSPGDSYEIVDFIDIGSPSVLFVNGASRSDLVNYENVKLHHLRGAIRQNSVFYNVCRFYGNTSNSFRFGEEQNSQLNCCAIYDPLLTFGFMNNRSYLQLLFCGVIGPFTLFTNANVAGNTSLDIRNSLLQTCALNLGKGFWFFDNVGLFDSNNPTRAILLTERTNGILSSNIFGTNPSTTNAVEMTKGTGLSIAPGTTPFITAATRQVFVDGLTSHIPPLVASASVPATSTLTTWAEWAAAPFSRKLLTAAGTSLTEV